MIQKFFEYKLTSEQYDNLYYLVLEYDSRTVRGLSRGKFKGLKGITNYIDVIKKFFRVFDSLLLIMDKSEVNEINDIEKFNYYDINFLCNDYFKNFKRVMYYSYTKTARNIAQKLFNEKKRDKSNNNRYNKLKKLMAKKEYIELYDIIEINTYHLFDDTEPENFGGLISNFNFKYLEDRYKDLVISEDMVKKIFECLIIGCASYYEEENEYLINSDIFKIPKQSTIIINSTFLTEYPGSVKELRHRYKIKLINNKEEIFPIIRYLDKIKKSVEINV